jgi:hypothetical protein
MAGKWETRYRTSSRPAAQPPAARQEGHTRYSLPHEKQPDSAGPWWALGAQVLASILPRTVLLTTPFPGFPSIQRPPHRFPKRTSFSPLSDFLNGNDDGEGPTKTCARQDNTERTYSRRLDFRTQTLLRSLQRRQLSPPRPDPLNFRIRISLHDVFHLASLARRPVQSYIR